MRKSNYVSSDKSDNDLIMRSDLQRKWYSQYPTGQGDTVFRCVGEYNSSGFVPQIVDTGVEHASPKDSISDAVCEAECVMFWGPGKLYTITEPLEKIPGVHKTPASVCFDSIKNYAKEHRREISDCWYDWVNAPAPKYPLMSKPQRIIFLQGMVIKARGKDIVDRAGNPYVLQPCILRLNASSSHDFIKKLTTPKDASYPLSVENSELGDVMSAYDGRLIKIYSYTDEMRRVSYKLESLDKYPIDERLAQQIYTPFEQVLDFPSCEVAIERIAQAFSPGLAWWSLRETPYSNHIPDWIIEEGKVDPDVPGNQNTNGYAQRSTQGFYQPQFPVPPVSHQYSPAAPYPHQQAPAPAPQSTYAAPPAPRQAPAPAPQNTYAAPPPPSQAPAPAKQGTYAAPPAPRQAPAPAPQSTYAAPPAYNQSPVDEPAYEDSCEQDWIDDSQESVDYVDVQATYPSEQFKPTANTSTSPVDSEDSKVFVAKALEQALNMAQVNYPKKTN